MEKRKSEGLEVRGALVPFILFAGGGGYLLRHCITQG